MFEIVLQQDAVMSGTASLLPEKFLRLKFCSTLSDLSPNDEAANNLTVSPTLERTTLSIAVNFAS